VTQLENTDWHLTEQISFYKQTTACLAQDACGIPSEKVKKNLSELSVNQNASCTPGGGCC